MEQIIETIQISKFDTTGVQPKKNLLDKMFVVEAPILQTTGKLNVLSNCNSEEFYELKDVNYILLFSDCTFNILINDMFMLNTKQFAFINTERTITIAIQINSSYDTVVDYVYGTISNKNQSSAITRVFKHQHAKWERIFKPKRPYSYMDNRQCHYIDYQEPVSDSFRPQVAPNFAPMYPQFNENGNCYSYDHLHPGYNHPHPELERPIPPQMMPKPNHMNQFNPVIPPPPQDDLNHPFIKPKPFEQYAPPYQPNELPPLKPPYIPPHMQNPHPDPNRSPVPIMPQYNPNMPPPPPQYQYVIDHFYSMPYPPYNYPQPEHNNNIYVTPPPPAPIKEEHCHITVQPPAQVITPITPPPFEDHPHHHCHMPPPPPPVCGCCETGTTGEIGIAGLPGGTTWVAPPPHHPGVIGPFPPTPQDNNIITTPDDSNNSGTPDNSETSSE